MSMSQDTLDPELTEFLKGLAYAVQAITPAPEAGAYSEVVLFRRAVDVGGTTGFESPFPAGHTNAQTNKLYAIADSSGDRVNWDYGRFERRSDHGRLRVQP